MRNKAAEKAKHVQPVLTPDAAGNADNSLNPVNPVNAAAEQRLGGGYSINGILGIAGEKRKRQEHGKFIFEL